MSYNAFAKKHIPRASIPVREKPPKKTGEFKVGDQVRVCANPTNNGIVAAYLGSIQTLERITVNFSNQTEYSTGGMFFLHNEIEHA